MLWEKEDLKPIDGIMLVAIAVLLCFGLLAVYSATQSANPAISNNFSKQVIWVLVGITMMSAIIMMPLRLFYDYAYLFYGFSLALLVVVLFIGSGSGVKRWLLLGPVGFQPSEIAKLATLGALAKFASGTDKDFGGFRDIALAFLIILVPTALIIRQPDLGTSLVFVAMVLPVLYWAGMSMFTVFLLVAPLITLVSAFSLTTFFIAILLLVAVMFLSKRGLRVIIPNFILNIGVGVATPVLWNQLHAYQKSRILTFVGIEQDPRGLGYQVLQSKVAIGSGGLFGKGWTDGTQTQLRFLPEQHSDFIFSVIGEEFGLFGVTLILAMFFIILWRTINIATDSKNRFASLVAVGAAVIIAFHVLVNTGMTVGVMPVTGLPLPLLSYGGSALLTNMAFLGLIISAGRRRFQYL